MNVILQAMHDTKQKLLSVTRNKKKPNTGCQSIINQGMTEGRKERQKERQINMLNSGFERKNVREFALRSEKSTVLDTLN